MSRGLGTTFTVAGKPYIWRLGANGKPEAVSFAVAQVQIADLITAARQIEDDLVDGR